MSLNPHDFFDHQWTVTDSGVLSISSKRSQAPGAHTFVVHGIIVKADFEEEHHVSASTILTGGVLLVMVCDKTGASRQVCLSKANLDLRSLDSDEPGKFIVMILANLTKSKAFPNGQKFFGAFLTLPIVLRLFISCFLRVFDFPPLLQLSFGGVCVCVKGQEQCGEGDLGLFLFLELVLFFAPSR